MTDLDVSSHMAKEVFTISSLLIYHVGAGYHDSTPDWKQITKESSG